MGRPGWDEDLLVLQPLVSLETSGMEGNLVFIAWEENKAKLSC